eukprot:6436066-Pyramimonas_sp.AAC.1
MSYMCPHAMCTLEPMHAHTMTAVPTSTLPDICAAHHVPLKCNRRLVQHGYVRALCASRRMHVVCSSA